MLTALEIGFWCLSTGYHLLKWLFGPSTSEVGAVNAADLGKILVKALVIFGACVTLGSTIAVDAGHVLALFATAISAAVEALTRYFSPPKAPTPPASL